MFHVMCDNCWVVHGTRYYCYCRSGPTRSDPSNPAEPWIDKSMGRNEKSDEEFSAMMDRHESKGNKV